MSTTAELPPEPAATQHHEAEGLDAGHLSRGQIVGLALASYVPAVGLASVPVLLLATAGNGSWLGALIAALATVSVGMSVIAFARRYVVTGSLYSYISQIFGTWARSLMGATLLLGYVAQIAGITLIVGIFSGSFLLSVGVDSGLDVGMQTAIYVVAVGVSAAVAYRGLDTSVRTAVTLAALSVPLMLVITVAVGLDTGLDLGSQLSLEGATASGIIQGVAAGAAFLVGFESSAALAAETRDPKRNVPLAIMSIPIILGSLYVLATIFQIPGLTAASEALGAGASPASALALEAGFGADVAKATDLVLAIATFASLIGFVNYGSRFIATLGADHVLPGATARVHPRFRSPSIAIVLISTIGLALIIVLVALNPDDILTVYASIATLIVYFWVVPYLLICAGAVVLLAREKQLMPWLVGSALVGASAMAWLYVNGIVNPPPAPVDAMSWVFLVATVVVFAGFYLGQRLRAGSGR
jgi:amino acid transporter